ncbi:hypothetical protein CYMTET_53239, partial [Cymbomonas tetramitiformis]
VKKGKQVDAQRKASDAGAFGSRGVGEAKRDAAKRGGERDRKLEREKARARHKERERAQAREKMTEKEKDKEREREKLKQAKEAVVLREIEMERERIRTMRGERLAREAKAKEEAEAKAAAQRIGHLATSTSSAPGGKGGKEEAVRREGVLVEPVQNEKLELRDSAKMETPGEMAGGDALPPGSLEPRPSIKKRKVVPAVGAALEGIGSSLARRLSTGSAQGALSFSIRSRRSVIERRLEEVLKGASGAKDTKDVLQLVRLFKETRNESPPEDAQGAAVYSMRDLSLLLDVVKQSSAVRLQDFVKCNVLGTLLPILNHLLLDYEKGTPVLRKALKLVHALPVSSEQAKGVQSVAGSFPDTMFKMAAHRDAQVQQHAMTLIKKWRLPAPAVPIKPPASASSVTASPAPSAVQQSTPKLPHRQGGFTGWGVSPATGTGATPIPTTPLPTTPANTEGGGGGGDASVGAPPASEVSTPMGTTPDGWTPYSLTRSPGSSVRTDMKLPLTSVVANSALPPVIVNITSSTSGEPFGCEGAGGSTSSAAQTLADRGVEFAASGMPRGGSMGGKEEPAREREREASWGQRPAKMPRLEDGPKGGGGASRGAMRWGSGPTLEEAPQHAHGQEGDGGYLPWGGSHEEGASRGGRVPGGDRVEGGDTFGPPGGSRESSMQWGVPGGGGSAGLYRGLGGSATRGPSPGGNAAGGGNSSNGTSPPTRSGGGIRSGGEDAEHTSGGMGFEGGWGKGGKGKGTTGSQRSSVHLVAADRELAERDASRMSFMAAVAANAIAGNSVARAIGPGRGGGGGKGGPAKGGRKGFGEASSWGGGGKRGGAKGDTWGGGWPRGQRGMMGGGGGAYGDMGGPSLMDVGPSGGNDYVPPYTGGGRAPIEGGSGSNSSATEALVAEAPPMPHLRPQWEDPTTGAFEWSVGELVKHRVWKYRQPDHWLHLGPHEAANLQDRLTKTVVHKEIKNWKLHGHPIVRDQLIKKIKKFVHDHVHTSRAQKDGFAGHQMANGGQ